jgi:hypothetical protein
MRDRDHKPPVRAELVLETGRLGGTKLPRPTAAIALQVSVFRIGPNVVFLPPVGSVAVDDESELFERVERSIDGRGRDVRILGAASLDKLARRHVTLRSAEDFEDRPPLWSPAHAPCPELVANSIRLESP